MLVHNIFHSVGQGGAIPKIASASIFRPEPLAIRMLRLQNEGSASFQIDQSSIHWGTGLQNGMDVIRADMYAEQMPLAICAGTDNRVQNKIAVLRPEDKLGFRHESPGLVLPSGVGRQSGRSPVSMTAGYRARVGAREVGAIGGEGEQDTNRFAHGSQTFY